MSTWRCERGPQSGPVDRLPHFLLVDDDELISRCVCRVLRVARPRWVLVSVATAAEAARELSRQEYDVLIADLALPGLPGTALLEYARCRHPSVARVVFSALADRARHHPEVQAAHGVLEKPTTPDELVSALAVALRTGAGIRNTLRPPCFSTRPQPLAG
jgi:DNA-binding NarL/FixJ family response regulator